MLNLAESLSSLTFTVFDTETTGLSPERGARLLEIGAIRVEPGLRINMATTFNELINPGRPIPYEAFKVHGINDSMVKDKPDASEVIPRFASFVEGSIVVAHNAKFDMSFINWHMRDLGITSGVPLALCTVRLSKAAFPGLRRYSLDAMIEHLGLFVSVDDGWRHRALYDAAYTSLLLVRCIESLQRKGCVTLQQLCAI